MYIAMLLIVSVINYPLTILNCLSGTIIKYVISYLFCRQMYRLFSIIKRPMAKNKLFLLDIYHKSMEDYFWKLVRHRETFLLQE